LKLKFILEELGKTTVALKQTSFSSAEFAAKKRITRREQFLAEMEQVVPWAELEAVIAPVYPNGMRGRPPIGLSRMLRVYFIQQWYSLSDEAVEDAIYDSQAVRAFVGVDLARETAPDATTLLKFRRLLETNDLTQRMFVAINATLTEKGLLMRSGTIVDATIINAPSSTKNAEHKRDEDMHQTKKGNEWYFGMKAHIGVDAESGLVHSLTTTAANVADIIETAALLHGDEDTVFADAGYTGVAKREEMNTVAVDWQIAAKRSIVKKVNEKRPLRALLDELEHAKASIRAKVEHPFHVVKNLFRHRKTRYKGLPKNTAHVFMLFGLANLVIAKNKLLAWQAQTPSTM
jgi:IS5 family transposase